MGEGPGLTSSEGREGAKQEGVATPIRQCVGLQLTGCLVFLASSVTRIRKQAGRTVRIDCATLRAYRVETGNGFSVLKSVPCTGPSTCCRISYGTIGQAVLLKQVIP